jgi:hypothetical protein
LVRISFSALLRVKEDDRYLLFDTPSRPASYGPPGGVIKYFEPALRTLGRLGFREDRSRTRSEQMRSDLRGLLPTGAVREFRRWFASGAYREDATECLHRELVEELGQVGHPCQPAELYDVEFVPVRVVMEGPHAVPNRQFRQLRRFEVYDIANTSTAAMRLRRRLIELGQNLTVPGILWATADEIVYGRSGSALIAPQSAFLMGTRRYLPDLPAVL